MNTFFLLLWLACTVAMVYFLLQVLRKRGRKRNVGFAFLGGFVALILFGATVSPSTRAAAEARSAPSEAAPKPTPAASEGPSERLLAIQGELVKDCVDRIPALYAKYAPSSAAIKTVIPARIVGQQVRAQVQAGGVKFNCSASEGSQDFDAPQIADPVLARKFAAEEAAAEERAAAQARAAQEQAAAAAAKQEQCGQVQLVLESWTWGTEGGDFVKATGQVTNVTDSNIENAEASVSYYTADETFVKNGDAMIDYNPILPGQRSPFSTIDTGNPAIEKASIEFKELFGGTLSVMERKEYDRICG